MTFVSHLLMAFILFGLVAAIAICVAITLFRNPVRGSGAIDKTRSRRPSP